MESVSSMVLLDSPNHNRKSYNPLCLNKASTKSKRLIGMYLAATYCQKPKTTKQETLEWNKGKIADSQNYPADGLLGKNSFLNDFSFLYNECTIQYSFKGDTKGNQVIRFQKMDLSNIDIKDNKNHWKTRH